MKDIVFGSEQLERRKAQDRYSPWAELGVDSSWRPSDLPGVNSEAWLRTHGFWPERREVKESPASLKER